MNKNVLTLAVINVIILLFQVQHSYIVIYSSCWMKIRFISKYQMDKMHRKVDGAFQKWNH